MSIVQLAQSSQMFQEEWQCLCFAVASAMTSTCLLFNTLETILYGNTCSFSSWPCVPVLLSNSYTYLGNLL